MTDQSENGDAQVTQLLMDWQQGNETALGTLTPIIYGELRRLARSAMRAEQAGHTLQPTALVHEAYEKLIDADIDWQSRSHFYAVAARVMRRVLVDHARARNSQKRGGGLNRMTLDDSISLGEDGAEQMLELDAALARLGEFDARKMHIVELIYFGGLTYDETANVLEVSAVTVHRDLKMAKAWLNRELAGETP